MCLSTPNKLVTSATVSPNVNVVRKRPIAMLNPIKTVMVIFAAILLLVQTVANKDALKVKSAWESHADGLASEMAYKIP